jgi:hypothetical protein
LHKWDVENPTNEQSAPIRREQRAVVEVKEQENDLDPDIDLCNPEEEDDVL